MPTTTPPPDAPLYIVLNAGSGAAETDERREAIEAVLEAAGRRFHIELVEDPERIDDQARAQAVRARDDGAILVAAGGDGTINAVARQAVEHGCPFGALPQGTFNYFGRTHGIPQDLTDAVHALLRASIQPVQIGSVNGRIFLVNASIGLYPKLLEEREHDKRQFGRSRFVAALSALKTLVLPHRRLRLSLEAEGKTIHLRTSTLFVGNNRLQMEQVGLTDVTPDVADGELAALAPKPVGRLRMFLLMARGALGMLADADDLVAFGFRRMTVRTPLYGRRRLKAAVDGEILHLTAPLQFEALGGRLLLLVPAAGDAVSG
ncbi:diacylglycerol/lipid kinase family protein [Pseudoduganella chitinolytica]|uniref:Diacylglycerol kinase family protein n=1 Tax=Pseudoduganella chitinolytica TaxID=34070 RepID=A0ABY8BFY7_9BURK|nr:diacylglycerol kinase family protein [Pseudoduganella chitinolytica]WEF34827.1 diacylglycerol kinase family protein [Pseudoduganella chitinolytica]